MDKLKNRAKGGRGEQKIPINTSHFTLNSSLSRVSVYPSSKSETVHKILRQKMKLKQKVTLYNEYEMRDYKTALCESHLVDDLVQDDCIEASFTWPFLIFCGAVLRLEHPTKVGPKMTIRCCQNHPH